MLNIKRVILHMMEHMVETVSKTGVSTGSISANGYKNQTITPTVPNGKSLRGVVEYHINGTNSSYCQLIGVYISGNDIHVQMKNTSSGSVTWTVDATGIYW